jgi:hypothetical protein
MATNVLGNTVDYLTRYSHAAADPNYNPTAVSTAKPPSLSNDAGGAGYDTGLDHRIGGFDAQIKQQQALQGTSSYDQGAVDRLNNERQYINAQRWQSAGLMNSSDPARTKLAGLLQSGTLTYADLAKVDISVLHDPVQLAQAIDQLVKSKTTTAVQPGPTPTTPGPTEQAAADAQKASEDVMPSVLAHINDFSQDNPNSGLGQLEKSHQQTLQQISSTGTRLGRQLGGEAGGFAANQSAANEQAGNAAAKQNQFKNDASDLNSFINSSLSNEVNQQADVTQLDTAKRVDIQRQGLMSLQDTIKSAINTSDAGAQAHLQQLDGLIADWNTKVKANQDSTAELHKILGIAAGLLMGAGAVTAAATGVGAPLAVGLGAGSVSTLAAALR